MSGWQHASSVTPSGWGKTVKTPSKAWLNCKPARPCMSGHPLIIPRRPTPTLVEYFPTKIIKLKKGTLSDLLSLDIDA